VAVESHPGRSPRLADQDFGWDRAELSVSRSRESSFSGCRSRAGSSRLLFSAGEIPRNALTGARYDTPRGPAKRASLASATDSEIPRRCSLGRTHIGPRPWLSLSLFPALSVSAGYGDSERAFRRRLFLSLSFSHAPRPARAELCP